MSTFLLQPKTHWTVIFRQLCVTPRQSLKASTNNANITGVKVTYNLTSLLIRDSEVFKHANQPASSRAGLPTLPNPASSPHSHSAGFSIFTSQFPNFIPVDKQVKSMTSSVSKSLCQFRSFMVCFGDKGTVQRHAKRPRLVAFLDGVFRPGPPSHSQRQVKRDIMQHRCSGLHFQNKTPFLVFYLALNGL